MALTIHAAGILHEASIVPEKSLYECNADALLRLFAINSIGPLMVAKEVLARQSRMLPFRFVALSAMVGSISDNRLGGWYGYRASKAALNQFVKTLAVECRRRFPNATVAAVHPGTTDTSLSAPYTRNVPPDRLYSTEETAGRVLDVVRNLTPESSGGFFHWDGTSIPW